MSRALEPDVASSLKTQVQAGSGDKLAEHKEMLDVYTSLTSALQPHLVVSQSQSPSSDDVAAALAKPLQVEMLPSSYPFPDGTSVLVDSDQDEPYQHLGVTKKTLVKAFVVARQILLDVRSTRGRELAHEDSLDEKSSRALQSSAVILLLDAEHLTAANTRKRALIARGLTGPDLDAEQWLLDALLTSPLHRHTKSPTLWAHRRWLVQQREDQGLHFNWKREVLEIGMKAAERHPRNYYAWSYVRWIVAMMPNQDEELKRGPNDEPHYPDVWTAVVHHTRDWCYEHRGDISGWTFLYWLLKHLEQSGPRCGNLDRPTADPLPATSLILAAIRDVLETVKRSNWHNESIEMFLRLSLGDIHLVQEKQEIMAEVGQSLGVDVESSPGPSAIQAALQWLHHDDSGS